jgi:hypothetical protein
MKKDNLPVWPSDTNKGGSKSIEVFFLGKPKKAEKNTEPEPEPNTGETFLVSKDKINPLGKYTFKEACDILSSDKEIQSLIEQLNKQDGNTFPVSGNCCPIGPKGHTGWKGIKIDDTIPSDFVDTEDLVLGSIYKIAALKLTVKFTGQIMIPTNKTLLQVSRHGVPFYVDEGCLIKATQLEIEYYINDNPF